MILDTIKYSDNINTKNPASLNVSQNSNLCISMLVSLDENCCLNVTLNSNTTTILGFNKNNNPYKIWKRIEITAKKNSGTLFIHRFRNDNETRGFWAITDIEYCRPKFGNKKVPKL